MPDRVVWTRAAWEDCLSWQSQDRKTLKRIDRLIEECMRDPHAGIGKPEPLRENLSVFWSRRIDDTHRLVYTVSGNDLAIVACRYHYE